MAGSVARCVCLTGPTACGKTEIALAVAERLPVEIVSMDSAMVYRGLDIGTAKPSAAVRERVPHHLVDILEPNDAYSAGRFARDAAAAVRAITARGRLPLLVGGTLLYLRALREGLASLPRADAAVRNELDAQARELGWPALHARLQRVDPAAAARIAPTDRQRIQRALEVHALTGRPLSELQGTVAEDDRLDIATVALVPEDRASLARRIERRFDAMVELGVRRRGAEPSCARRSNEGVAGAARGRLSADLGPSRGRLRLAGGEASCAGRDAAARETPAHLVAR